MIFKEIVEQIPMGIFIVDEKGAVLYANSAGERILETLCFEDKGEFPLTLCSKNAGEYVVPDRSAGDRVFDFEGSDIEWNGTRARLVRIKEITRLRNHEHSAALRQEQMLKADKMHALSALVSGVAHQINNPNNLISLDSQILREIFNGLQGMLEGRLKHEGDFKIGKMQYSRIRSKIPQLLDSIDEGVGRIETVVSELRDYMRETSADHKQVVDLGEVVAAGVSLMSSTLKKASDRFSFVRPGYKVRVMANSQRLQHVIISLLQNACRALTDRSQAIEVTIDLSNTRTHAELVVRDEGSGMSADTQEHALDPFFTTHQENGAMGMGLSVCESIVREHEGRMEINSVAEHGTVVRVALPIVTDEKRGKSR